MGKKIENGKKKKNRIWHTIKIVFLIMASLVFAFIAFFAVKLFNLDAWDSFDVEKITNASCSLIIYDKLGEEAVRLDSGEDRIPVKLENIPKHVQRAFISIEDARFYEHNGIDIVRIFGALWADIKAGGYVQGASTISQQLIKLSHLSNEKTMMRKLEEAVLAYQLEQAYSKDEILEMYLNFVYFGGGFYGIEAASQGYFGIPSSELTVEQGATLAAILKSPTKYAPHLNIEASKERRDLVLSLMCNYGYLSESEKNEAQSKPVLILDSVNSMSIKRGYYIDEVIRKACDILEVTNEELLCGGYRIYTAMDSELQRYAEDVFAKSELFPDSECEGAFVLQRADGGVAVMIGGRSTDNAMAFNRAVDIRRQPGSVIKPIICYAPALMSGKYTAASIILDEKCEFGDYAPSNYGDKYNGYVTLREAVKGSLNIPAVKVLEDISVEAGKGFANKCGIEFDEADTSLTLALGGFTYGVSPLEISEAYTVFASGGIHTDAYMIKEIQDKNGETLYAHMKNEERIMSEDEAFILTSMLVSAIEEGTGRRLGELEIELAGKTGTVDENHTEGNRDAWMAAYNSEYTAVVWMGYDTSHGGKALPSEATGGKYPALILKEMFSKIYEKKEAPSFKKPSNVIRVNLDAWAMKNENKAVLASSLTPKTSVVSEFFVKGTQPNEESNYWQLPRGVKNFKVELNETNKPFIAFEMQDDFATYRLYRTSGETEVLLGEFSGKDNIASIQDNNVKAGREYTYFVVPFHSELYINGELVKGVESKHVSIKIPVDNQYGTDEVIKDTEDGF
ncbi:MAG: PBP1A family penicillin-binding protein [Clostridia bacterium]|nr:PBP1A family penicillin-binding protein [Clostridia bacterium]